MTVQVSTLSVEVTWPARQQWGTTHPKAEIVVTSSWPSVLSEPLRRKRFSGIPIMNPLLVTQNVYWMDAQ